jgi:hypothetical protein
MLHSHNLHEVNAVTASIDALCVRAGRPPSAVHSAELH